MEDKSKTIFVYLLVIFFAAFVGTSIFLILSNKKPSVEKAAVATNVSSTAPIAKSTQGSLNLKVENGEISFAINKELKIDIVADSNGKNIIGYDLVLSYDPSSFEFVNATSNLADFKIYPYRRNNYVSFLGTKAIESQTSSIFAQTKIVSLIFKPKKVGKSTFSLKPSITKDNTDLVTDKTEVINPQLNSLEITVN
jgi:hypothetical protein